MTKEWHDTTYYKDQEVLSLKRQLNQALAELNNRNRPGSSNDAPRPTAAATHTTTKIKSETNTKEEK